MKQSTRTLEDEYKNYLSDHMKDTYGDDMSDASALKRSYHESNVLPHIGTDKSIRILEIGPGFGEFLTVLNERGYNHITAVDISEEVVQYIRKVLPSVQCDLSGDLTDFLGKSSTQYHHIVMLDVLEHLPREIVVPVLQAIRNSLTSDGSVIIQTCNAASPHSENIFFSDFTHQWNYTEFSLRQVMASAGFTSVTIEGYRFPKGLIGALRTIVRRVLYLKTYIMAIVNGIVRIKVLEPNLIAIGRK